MRARLSTLVLAALLAFAAVGAPAFAKGKADIVGVVNLNQGSEDALQMLPGIGQAKAARIVAHRLKHPFKKVDELVKVKGFGRKTLAKLRKYLTVSGPTTISDESAPDGAAADSAVADKPAERPRR